MKAIGPDQLGSAFLPPTDKLNDLVPVARLHGGFHPLRSRKNLEVALDGNSVGGQAQVGKQGGNAKTFGHFARFTIHDNLNRCTHRETGAVASSPGFDFSRNRNSP